MAGGNGRRGIWLPPGAVIRPNDTAGKDSISIWDWLAKPDTPATRGEVVAFGDVLVKTKVMDLLREVFAVYEQHIRTIVREEMLTAPALVSATHDNPIDVGAFNGPVPAPPPPPSISPEDAAAIDEVVGRSEATTAPPDDEDVRHALRLVEARLFGAVGDAKTRLLAEKRALEARLP